MLTLYVVKLVVYWVKKAWNLWKVWRILSATFGSIRKNDLWFFWRDHGLSDLSWFLAVFDGGDWTPEPQKQTHCEGCDDIRSSGRTGLHGNFVRFVTIHKMLCAADATCHGRKVPVSFVFENDSSNTIPLPFDTIAEPSTGTHAADTDIYVDTKSNRGTSEFSINQVLFSNEPVGTKVFPIPTKHPTQRPVVRPTEPSCILFHRLSQSSSLFSSLIHYGLVSLRCPQP